MKVLLALLIVILSTVSLSPAAEQASSASTVEKCSIAFNAFKEGKFETAIKEFEEVIGSLSVEQRNMYKDLLADVYYHLGLCYYNVKNYQKAVEYFKLYRDGNPEGQFSEKSLFGMASAQLELQDYEAAATAYETALKEFPQSKLKLEYMMNLAGCYFELDRDDEAMTLYFDVMKTSKDSEIQLQCALAIMEMAVDKFPAERNEQILNQLLGNPPRGDFVAFLAPYILQVADQFYEIDKLDNALRWYHLVPPKQKVLDFYTGLLTKLQREYRQRSRLMPNAPETQALERRLKKLTANVKDFAAMPDYTPSVLYRLARVYFDRGEYYESRILYRRIDSHYPDASEAPLALYGQILCNTELDKPAITLALADEFTRKYPSHELRDSVGYLRGEMLFKVKQYSNAVTQFEQELTQNPGSDYADRMKLLVAHSYFMLGQFDTAKEKYNDLYVSMPNSVFAPEALYRQGLCFLYNKNLTNGLETLQDFIQKYPSSEVSDDAAYRVGEVKYILGNYDGSLQYIDYFTNTYPETQLGSPALMLAGDDYIGLMGQAASAPAFASALSNAVDRFRQLKELSRGHDDKRWRYAVLQEGQCFKFAEDDQAMIHCYSGFLTNYPKDALAAQLLSEIADAYGRAGQNERADEIYHEAIERGGEDPTNEVADKCLVQYSQILLRNSYSNEFALRFLEWKNGLDSNSLLRARIQGVLLDLYQQTGGTNEYHQLLRAIEHEYSNRPYPAPLAVRLAENAVNAGQTNEAAAIYRSIVDSSAVGQPYVRARLGLAWIEFYAGDYAAARTDFRELERFVSDQLLVPQIVYGLGACALKLDDYTAAREYFQQLLANREWRGEYTAAALYGLGELEAIEGRDDAAHVYFQRIYVLYGAYREWVVQAYIAAAQCLERLGRKQEALRTYAELLGREDLADFEALMIKAEELSGLTRERVILTEGNRQE